MGNKPSVFTRFADLPAELRLKIWHLASQNLDPICLNFFPYCDEVYDWLHTAEDSRSYTPPKILFVNHESREEALRRFQRFTMPTCLRLSHRQPPLSHKLCQPMQRIMFIDPSRDLLYINFWVVFQPAQNTNWDTSWHGTAGAYGRIQELAITDVSFFAASILKPPREGYRPLIQLFARLKKLYLVEARNPWMGEGGYIVRELRASEHAKDCENVFLEHFRELKRQDPGWLIPQIIVSPWRPLDRTLWADQAYSKGRWIGFIDSLL